MYWPRHRPQLNNAIPTAAVDCGVRATQMGLDAISGGDVMRSVDTIRDIGKMGDGPTNYYEWDAVIDKLGGRTEGFSGEKTNDWSAWNQHIRNGGWGITAVHYGTQRRLMPGKVGSLTFSAFHAILYGGFRRRSGGGQTRSFDSLLDGRYRGCPDGPVWVPQWKVRDSAHKVGQLLSAGDTIYAVMLHPDKVIEPTDPGAPLPVPVEFDTLPDILSDLMGLAADKEAPVDMREDLSLSVDALRLILGVKGNPEATEDTDIDAGITI